jgi:hypothetical protein
MHGVAEEDPEAAPGVRQPVKTAAMPMLVTTERMEPDIGFKGLRWIARAFSGMARFLFVNNSKCK